MERWLTWFVLLKKTICTKNKQLFIYWQVLKARHFTELEYSQLGESWLVERLLVYAEGRLFSYSIQMTDDSWICVAFFTAYYNDLGFLSLELPWREFAVPESSQHFLSLLKTQMHRFIFPSRLIIWYPIFPKYKTTLVLGIWIIRVLISVHPANITCLISFLAHFGFAVPKCWFHCERLTDILPVICWTRLITHNRTYRAHLLVISII